MRSKNKKLKGFTLLEIIVAMLILGLCSSVLVMSYVSAMGHIKNNNQLNDRMTEQQIFIEKTKGKTSAAEFDVVCTPDASNYFYGPGVSGDTAADMYVGLKCTHTPVTISDGVGLSTSTNLKISCAVYTLKNIENGVVAADDDDVNPDLKYFVMTTKIN